MDLNNEIINYGQAGLIHTVVEEGEPKYYALLDKGNPPYMLDFEVWWNEVIFKDMQNNTFSRRDIVLNVANKDGGAYIDTSLPEITINYQERIH